MKNFKVEKAVLTFQVMRVNGKYFIGNHGTLSPVPDSACGVIAELEVSMNKVLDNKLKSKKDDTINSNDSSDPLSG